MQPGRPTLFDVLGVIAVAAMLTSLAMLVQRNSAGFGELDVEVTQEELEAGFREGFEYHSLYMGADKIGTLRTERRRNGDGYHIRTDLDFVIEVGPLTQRTESRLDAFLDDAFRLDRFELELSGSLMDAQIQGRWTGEGILVDGLPGESDPRLFELPEAPLVLPSLRPVLMRSNLGVGDRLSFTYYDPMSQAPITADIAFVGEEQIELMGRSVQAFHFEEIALGHRTHVWVNALGEVLIEEMPLGIRAVREPEAEARYGLDARGTEPLDASALADTQADTQIDGPVLKRARWTRGRFVMSQAEGLVDDAESLGQIVTQQGKGVVIVTQMPATMPPLGVINAREREAYTAYLGEAGGIRPRAPEVLTVYREVIGETKPVSHRAEALTRHCARAIRWLPGVDEGASAERVLSAGSGTSLGKARALAALLRAGEIPSRIVHGLVVQGDRLVQHVWVEAWMNTWLPLDPTFDQSPADAGHIRLGAGGRLERVWAQGVLHTFEITSIEGE